MIAMQRVQPEIKKLQAKYKDDRQKLNEEMMKFYQENKINPLAGCLPLLVQMPVFFALFRVLHDIQDHIPTTGAFNDLFAGHLQRPVGLQSCVPRASYFLGMDLRSRPRTRAASRRLPRAAPVLHRSSPLVVAHRLVPDVADPAPPEPARHEPEQPDQQADADDHDGSSRSSSGCSRYIASSGLVALLRRRATSGGSASSSWCCNKIATRAGARRHGDATTRRHEAPATRRRAPTEPAGQRRRAGDGDGRSPNGHGGGIRATGTYCGTTNAARAAARARAPAAQRRHTSRKKKRKRRR